MCKSSSLGACTEACATSCMNRPCSDPDCKYCPAPENTAYPFPNTATFGGIDVPVTDGRPVGIASRWSYAYRPDTFQATFADLFQEAFDLLVKRQVKYGPENISTQGFYGVFTRLKSDKIERLAHALNGRVVDGRIELDPFVDADDDTVEDAILDTVNYALILLALKRGLWGRPLEDPA